MGWVWMVLLALAPALALAQDPEPRAYSNAPVGLNFLITGYFDSKGGLSTDPSLPVTDAHLQIHTAAIAYARSLDLWGKSGKVDVILPYSRLSGTAMAAGQQVERNINGFGDPRLRLSINLYGAPALSLREYASYQQDLVIGASVQIAAPGSQYDPARAVNLASNRWLLKPDFGLSKTLGAVTLDFTVGASLFSDNDNYFGGKTLTQEPVYFTQGSISYNFNGGAWAALGASYYEGGRTTVSGVRNDDKLGNSRTVVILALPVDRQHSIKVSASKGLHTRIGTDFKTFGVAWQYRWGAGF
ncbi:MAG: transporter [Sulfuritalea sp.]|nr:transporter [Sulfuritalea sp.]